MRLSRRRVWNPKQILDTETCESLCLKDRHLKGIPRRFWEEVTEKNEGMNSTTNKEKRFQEKFDISVEFCRNWQGSQGCDFAIQRLLETVEKIVSEEELEPKPCCKGLQNDLLLRCWSKWMNTTWWISSEILSMSVHSGVRGSKMLGW